MVRNVVALDNNGFAEQTGWITSGEGLLCLPDTNGKVTNELFPINWTL